MPAIKKEPDRKWFDESEPESSFAREVKLMAVCLAAAALTWAAMSGRLDEAARRFLGW